jgi:hypothetical protein
MRSSTISNSDKIKTSLSSPSRTLMLPAVITLRPGPGQAGSHHPIARLKGTLLVWYKRSGQTDDKKHLGRAQLLH